MKETVIAAQNGDEKAFEALYHEHAKRVYYLALKITRSKEDAEDITQEVFIYVYSKITELNNPEAFASWLGRITVTKCTDAFRKHGKEVHEDLSDFDESLFTEETDPLLIPEKSLDNAETARMIVEIIDALPDTQRLCVYYYYYEQMTIAQIAEALTANENTIKKRLYLARDKIRKELERLNEEEGIKLYSAVPLMLTPIFKMSLQKFEMPPELTQSLWGRITDSHTANAASAVNASANVSAAAAAKGTIFMGIKAKIAVIIGGFVLAGGVITGVIILTSNDDKPVSANTYRPASTTAATAKAAPSTNEDGFPNEGIYGDFEYRYYETSNEMEIARYIGKSTEVIIPSEIMGIPVTRIGVRAFDGGLYSNNDRDVMRAITSIKIPDSVTVIGDRVFEDCISLTDINIPEGVEKIDDGAFSGCYSLKTIILPESITYIGTWVFAGTGLESVIIPEGITAIRWGTFSDCFYLKSITLPESLETIGIGAFSATAIQTITIPDNVTSMEEFVFMYCNDLQNVYYKGIAYNDDNWQENINGLHNLYDIINGN